MRCPTLGELPPPPPGKTGWPWTDESEQLPDTMPDGSPWPKVSIVTPSYNQGQFIEETIRSVLLQGYPNLEYIIIDGGSTDDSVEIIRKYEPWLAYWVSEPDRGQSHAINKGFALATGSLLGWENSDDLLRPEALHRLAIVHVQHPHSLLAGSVINLSNDLEIGVVHPRNLTFRNCVEFWTGRRRSSMPGIFYPRGLIDQVGGLDEDLRYAFDLDLLCRLLQVSSAVYLPQHPVACFRLHPESKSVAEGIRFMPEDIVVSERYEDALQDVDRGGLLACVAEKYAVAGGRSLKQGKLKDGLQFLSKSAKLSPWGIPRYVLRAIQARIRKYTYIARKRIF